MGIQETAQDVLHLVQALAEGKQLEWRSRSIPGALWCRFTPEDGVLPFSIKDCEYRVKTDPHAEWKAAVLDMLDKIYLNRTAAFAAMRQPDEGYMRDLNELLDRGPRGRR